eukprot:3931134-Pleurochrysis_carterae.AAC.1
MVASSGSIGPKSARYLPCLMWILPALVKRVPWRATRVGKQLSKVSTPCGTMDLTDCGRGGEQGLQGASELQRKPGSNRANQIARPTWLACIGPTWLACIGKKGCSILNGPLSQK